MILFHLKLQFVIYFGTKKLVELIFLGLIENELIFLGDLQNSWTPPADVFVQRVPPG